MTTTMGVWLNGNTATNGYSQAAVGEWYSAALYIQKKTGQNFTHIYNYNANHPIIIAAGSSTNGETTSARSKVGIGTTSPNAPLEVHGADIATGATTTASSVLRLVRDVVDPTHTLRKDSAVDFMLSRQQAVANNLPYTRLDIRLSGTTDSSSPTLDVMSLLHNGRVGIGTTSPTRKLDISAPGNDGIRIASANALIGGGASGGDTQLIYWNGSTAYYGRSSLGGSVSQHEFRTSGTTRLTIDSSGNAGIGTTSPSEKLEVVGDILIHNGVDSTLYLGKGAEGVDGVTKIKSVQTGSDTDQLGLAFNVHSNTAGSAVSEEAMRINHGGNVGIGNTSPAAQLHIGPNTLLASYTTNRTTLAVSDITNGAELILRGQSPRLWFDSTSGGNGQIYMDSVELQIYSGNPTSAGTQRLNINSSGATTFNNAFTFPTSDGSGNQVLQTDGSGNVSWATIAGVGTATTISDADGDTKIQVEESADEDVIRFDTAGTERARIGVDASSDSTLEIVRSGVPAASGKITFNGSGLITDVTSGYHALIVRTGGTEKTTC